MSCETHAASSVFRDTSTNMFLSQGLPPSLSGCGRLGLAISSGFDSSLGPGLQDSGGHSSFHSDASSGDHVRITMKTRVAVRDKKSHRFQVIPLRDITKDALSQAELSGQLTVPSTPANYSCTPFRKVVSFSQPKSLYSSASAQSLGTANGKENQFSEVGAGKGFKSRTLGSFDSKTSFSSLAPSPIEKNAVLVELDLNREDTKPASLPHLPSNRNSQEKAPVLLNLPLQDSYKNPFNSAGNTHTTSQSLHLQKRYKNDASKFISLGHFSSNSKLDVNNKATLERLSHDGVGEARFSCSSNERSKKRHAMRTPPLFLPYFERLASSTEPANPDEEQVHQETISYEKAEIEQDTMSNIVQIDNDRTVAPEFHYVDACLDDQAMPRRILEDPFIDSSGLIDFQPIDSPLHHSSPKSRRLSSRLRPGPNCQTMRRMQRNDRCPGGIVYPKTVLDLFVELDKAIESWSRRD